MRRTGRCRSAGPTGCVTSNFAQGGACSVRTSFYSPTQIAISPDGRRIYVAQNGFGNYALQEVDRDPATGNLTPNNAWCQEAPGSISGCGAGNQTPALIEPFDVALAPNGVDLYTTGYGSQRIGVFDIGPGRNTATVKPAPYGCLAVAADCGRVLGGGNNVEYIVPSPDGKHVYAMGLGRIFAFAVDRAPVCNSMPLSTAFNTAITIKLDCTDADGDPITFTKLRDPAKGQLGALQPDGTITYGPLGRLDGSGLVHVQRHRGGRDH